MKRVGVDVGGTFTDLIYVDDEAGVIRVHKLPTTPGDPSQGTIAGDPGDHVGGRRERRPRSTQVFHGTTIATNIVIEHNGATVGMITTEGYRDILHIARHKKPLNFSNYQDLPWQAYPVVRRRYRLTVPERITRDGSVLVPLDEDAAREQVRQAEGGRRRGGVRVLPVLVRQRGARAAGRRDRARGVPGGVPVRLVGGAAAVPGVRALLDGLPERLHRPEGRDLREPPPGRAHAARRADGRAPDDVGVGRGDGRGGGRAAGEPAHVRPRRRRRRRDLGGKAGRVRERDHARRRRHLGGHRARAGGAPADEASPRHEGRARTRR